jgi:hypothetical protein
MSYRLLQRGVLRLSDNLTITPDMGEWQEYRAWRKGGGVPEPMIPAAPTAPTLAELKKRRGHVVTREAVARVQAVFPEVATLSSLIVMREMWLSVAPAARQPTPKLTAVIDIYTAWKTATDQIKACSTPECVAAVVPGWPA